MAVKSIGLVLLAALTAGPALAEEILRPRNKADFEAELRALQAQYGTPSAADEGAADAPAAITGSTATDPASSTAVAPVAEPVPATDSVTAAATDRDPGAAAAVASDRPLFPGTLLQPRRASADAGNPEAAPAAVAAEVPVASEDRMRSTPLSDGRHDAQPATPMPPFPGTVLRPRNAGGSEAVGTATGGTAAAAPTLPDGGFPGTVLRPGGGSAPSTAASPASINVSSATATATATAAATAATTRSADRGSAPLFEGTTLVPRGRDGAGNSGSSAPATTTGLSREVAPLQRLTAPPDSSNPDGIPALRVALLPVGQHQFQLREQIYDVDSLEIYLRQLQQPIDSVVLLSEGGRRIELGHLVALGRLGRMLRVPTLYQQGSQLRALNVR